MIKKTIVIITLSIALFTVGIWKTVNYFRPSQLMAEEGIPPDDVYYPPENDEIKQARAEWDRATKEERKKGCFITDKFGHQVFCEESLKRLAPYEERWHQAWLKSQSPSSDILAKRLSDIRELREDQNLTIQFRGESGNPYLMSNKRRMEDYEDNQGMYYIVDKISGIIISFQSAPTNTPRPLKFSPLISKEGLKKRGLAYLEKHIKNFEQVQKEFIFRENTKGEEGGNTDFMYALRWEGKRIPGEDMPPFVQLVQTSGGEIVTFDDTRVLYSE